MEGRTFHHPSRELEKTRVVYGGTEVGKQTLAELFAPRPFPELPYKLFWGEIHGHTELSDGQGTLDDYFSAARDVARLDFCAATDHDHGGVGRPELFGDKWELTQRKVAQYHDPPRFVTLLGYERDSWPWFSNLCIYYRRGTGETIRSEQDGEITRAELEALLARDDVLAIPHHTASLSQGVCFDAVPPELMPPLTEIYSKWGTSEFFGNPQPMVQEARGGHWHDALESDPRVRIGCVGGSDVHSPHPGLPHVAGGNLSYEQPGLLGVWAEELTREAIFDAMKARRTCASAGARVEIVLWINETFMGGELTVPEGHDRRLRLSVKAENALESVVVVKNARDYFAYRPHVATNSWTLEVADLKAERAFDYYYVRVTLQDGRRAWSSPIWVGRG